jgi:hypothetical protein
MVSWFLVHWVDVLLHLGLDLSGGLTLKCAIGMCEHKRHQYAVWIFGAIFLSFLTVYAIG